jgi:hypothetical protein
VYIFAYFSHSEEQDFAKSWITRIFTIFIILFGMLQQFFVAVDLSNSFGNGGIDFFLIFEIYY